MVDAGEGKFMDAEQELRRAKYDCLRWLKGFQNIQRSELFMKRFAEMANSPDHHTKEALFQAAIVSYAKPFTETETGQGRAILPVKPLKDDPSFEVDMHKHMMDLRHKLIAHDDFTAIEPKYAWVSLVDSSDPNGVLAPFQAYLRNSCISEPDWKRGWVISGGCASVVLRDTTEARMPHARGSIMDFVRQIL